MRLHPIFAALRRHKAGVVLIALQIALTLAIVCNATFIIGQRVQIIGRPSGMDERDVFVVSQQWVGVDNVEDPASVEKLDALQREDLAALRNMPDVAAVTPANSLPLYNSSWTGAVSVNPGHGEYDGSSNGTALVSYYYMDEQALAVLGAKLAEGRFFRADEVAHIGPKDSAPSGVTVISKQLAQKLFPGESALRKPLYIDGATKPSTIVGVLDRLQSPAVVRKMPWATVVIPARLDNLFARYVVRAKPGRLDAAMKATPGVLYRTNPMRILDEDNGLKSFAAIRGEAYQADLSMAILMGAVCLILIGVTAAGIVGLTSFWVGQRHRQIGVRRALGARKVDILLYFQMENLAIASGGAALGTVLAVGVNFCLMREFDMARLPLAWIAVGIVAVLVLGQAAVLAPARRASNVPPVAATRAS
ncbi:ABC transporter permease [Luteibacter sp. 3190]|uniref:ABC transporter permease n=1 Tax=Luteibacter sp. 3190 TaxID=2817736 RepID=UPI00286784BB|nr:ABC transporter permease [Luteibacter sp. 3190]MDR6937450.1 putative ABC transport system permease protein [Luteibacter sp. 3190]